MVCFHRSAAWAVTRRLMSDWRLRRPLPRYGPILWHTPLTTQTYFA